jgi:hypothetical protein
MNVFETLRAALLQRLNVFQSALKYVARERLDSRKIAPYFRLIDAALRDFRCVTVDFANLLDFKRASVE